MAIISKVYIAHGRVALAPTLRELDDIEIRVITEGTTNPGSTEFPFLVDYDDRAVLERNFEDDPTVEEYHLVEWTDGTGIYYIEHTPETKLISTVVTDVSGFLMDAVTDDEGWVVRLLLPDREALNTVWQYALENDITFDILEIYSNEDADGEGSYGLTDEQRTALRLAYEEGYFVEPREVSLDELAEELGLSSTAMSGRLRRGMRNLVATTLVAGENERE